MALRVEDLPHVLVPRIAEAREDEIRLVQNDREAASDLPAVAVGMRDRALEVVDDGEEGGGHPLALGRTHLGRFAFVPLAEVVVVSECTPEPILDLGTGVGGGS
jgi:hypothetical protein